MTSVRPGSGMIAVSSCGEIEVLQAKILSIDKSYDDRRP
jgi:hypothetical protein